MGCVATAIHEWGRGRTEEPSRIPIPRTPAGKHSKEQGPSKTGFRSFTQAFDTVLSSTLPSKPWAGHLREACYYVTFWCVFFDRRQGSGVHRDTAGDFRLTGTSACNDPDGA